MLNILGSVEYLASRFRSCDPSQVVPLRRFDARVSESVSSFLRRCGPVSAHRSQVVKAKPHSAGICVLDHQALPDRREAVFRVGSAVALSQQVLGWYLGRHCLSPGYDRLKVFAPFDQNTSAGLRLLKRNPFAGQLVALERQQIAAALAGTHS